MMYLAKGNTYSRALLMALSKDPWTFHFSEGYLILSFKRLGDVRGDRDARGDVASLSEGSWVVTSRDLSTLSKVIASFNYSCPTYNPTYTSP